MTILGIDTELIFGALVFLALLGIVSCEQRAERDCRVQLIQAGKAASDAEAAC